MEKQVVMTEEEYKGLIIEFTKHLRYHFKKGYGYKIISRETGEDILEREDNCLLGALFLPWNEVFK